MDNNTKFLLFVMLVSWLFIMGTRIGRKMDNKIDKLKEVKEKRCPAHKWEWEQQIGVEPPVFYMRCQWCRRLPGWGKD